MDVEFVPESDPPAAAEDVLATTHRRFSARAVNAALGGLVAAAVLTGWLTARPADRPAPRPAPTSTAPAAQYPDELVGCPDTLACDSNHEPQSHFLNLLRQTLRNHGR